MRTLVLAISALALASCVEAPKKPDFVDAGTIELTDKCLDPCSLPPVEFGNNVNLLPAIAANVDKTGSPDLIIGNSPEDPEFWGFLLVRGLATQNAQIQATPFKQTARRPISIHVEEFPTAPTKVFVFGDHPIDGPGVSIFAYSESTARFELGNDINGITVAGATGGSLASSLITAGQFDDDISVGSPDVVVACGSKLFIASCSGTSCDESFTEIINDSSSDAEGDMPPFPSGQNIRLIEGRASSFSSSAGALATAVGQQDLLIAGDGNFRWLTFAERNDAPAAWQSLPEYVSYSSKVNAEGVMGMMTGGSSANVVEDAVRDLVLAGPTNIDIAAFSKVNGVTQAVERYVAGDGFLDPHLPLRRPISPRATTLGGAPAVVFLESPNDGNSSLVALVGLEGLSTTASTDTSSVPYFGQWVEEDLGIGGAVFVGIDENDRIFVLFEDGTCKAFTYNPVGPLLVELPTVQCG